MKTTQTDTYAAGDGGTVVINGWASGVNNTAADIDILPSQLRDAVNVDIRDSGTPKRRTGYTALPITDPVQSVFAAKDFFLYKSGPIITSVNTALETIDTQSGFEPASHLACVNINGDLYVSDGRKSAKMYASTGVITDWSIPAPSTAPTLSVTTGTLPAGTYMVCTTNVSAYGEESPASSITTITLESEGGIIVSGLSANPDAVVDNVRVYASHADGAELYWNGYAVAAGTTYTTINSTAYSHALETRGMARVPVGDVLALSAGRLCSAKGRFVYYSAPLRFGVCKPDTDFLYFTKPVTLMYGTANGLYVCAGKTYYIANLGSEDMSQTELLPYGAVKGTLAVLKDNVGALWMSDAGVVRAIAAGPEITNLSIPRGVAINAARSGAGIIRQHDGMQTAIFVNNSPEGTLMASGDFFNAEVIRNNQ